MAKKSKSSFVTWIKSKKPEIILLLVACVFAFIIVETILQLTMPPNEHDKLFCYDEFLGWKFCPGAYAKVSFISEFSHSVQINSKGMRDSEEIDPAKKNIVVLGDSFVSNVGVENPKDVFTEVLQDEYLNGEYNVINLGVNGFGTAQEYLMLQQRGYSYNPEMVILIFYPRNDFYDNTGLLEWLESYRRPKFIVEDDKLVLTGVPVPRRDVNQSFKSKVYGVIKKSYVVNVLFAALSRMSSWIATSDFQNNIGNLPPEIVLANESDPDIANAYDVSCRILSQMNSELKLRGIEFYVFVPPNIFQVRDEFYAMLEDRGLTEDKRFYPNQRIIKCGLENGVNMIDMSPTFIEEAKKYEGSHFYYPVDKHWTAEGNKLAARIIYDELFNKSAFAVTSP
ncbi:SGNH/GDSL hydrolase family protein [Candidatus Woesearchaeota archaeon]|nr:SGNH/GDSL hydrolase family protein [Candidatus Woesearchaeota archaeon]